MCVCVCESNVDVNELDPTWIILTCRDMKIYTCIIIKCVIKLRYVTMGCTRTRNGFALFKASLGTINRYWDEYCLKVWDG